MIGIYCIINKITNDLYIGSSVNIKSRLCGHIKDLQNKVHQNAYLQYAYNKYEQNNFTFVILEKVKYKEDLIEREQYYIDYYEPEYNILHEAYSAQGYVPTKEALLKISKAHKGRKLSDEWKQNISLGNIGKKMTKEANQKNAKWHQGKSLSKEHKRKISNTLKGHTVSNETKHKIALSSGGKILSKETRQKISHALKGKTSPRKGVKLSEETKKKISNALKGRILSKIVKHNMSIAQKLAWSYKHV